VKGKREPPKALNAKPEGVERKRKRAGFKPSKVHDQKRWRKALNLRIQSVGAGRGGLLSSAALGLSGDMSAPLIGGGLRSEAKGKEGRAVESRRHRKDGEFRWRETRTTFTVQKTP